MSLENSPRTGGIAVAHAERTKVEVKETGVLVKVRDTVHSYTNHFIKGSRPYFPNTKLYAYIDCPCFLGLARVLCFASLFGALGSVNGVPKELSLGFFIVCTVLLCIYCQHEWVNQRSLPIIRRQPVFDGQRQLNWFYEVTITELKGMALENYRAGIGFVKVTQGKIKLQAFNKNAIKIIARAECQSRVMLVLFFLTSVYNLYFMVVAYSNSSFHFNFILLDLR